MGKFFRLNLNLGEKSRVPVPGGRALTHELWLWEWLEKIIFVSFVSNCRDRGAGGAIKQKEVV